MTSGDKWVLSASLRLRSNRRKLGSALRVGNGTFSRARQTVTATHDDKGFLQLRHVKHLAGSKEHALKTRSRPTPAASSKDAAASSSFGGYRGSVHIRQGTICCEGSTSDTVTIHMRLGSAI